MALSLLFIFAVVSFVTGFWGLGVILLALLLMSATGIAYFGVQTARRGVRQGQQQLARVQGELGQLQDQAQHQAARRELARLWNRVAPQLPAEVRPALRSAITAVDGALSAVDDDVPSRERYEVQQAATQDLPDLLNLHLRSAGDPAELRDSLALIERRMRHITARLSEERQREAAAQREYLTSKYSDDLLDSEGNRP